jgi:tRNA dimethylallyltransferase
VGKTDLSLSLASRQFEIVSADSVQVYRYLDIGSGKPSRADRERIRHHVIDIVDPDSPFSAGDFCRAAYDSCNEIAARGNIPLFVGGTGLYIDSFFRGLSRIPEAEASVRATLKRRLDEQGVEALHGELAIHDPLFASRISSRDTQRVLRGLEVFMSAGRPLSSFYAEKQGHQSSRTLFIGLNDERQLVRQRIAQRVDAMIDTGLVDEVRSLRERGYGPGLKSMKSIGYAEINAFLDNALSLDQAVEKIKTNTAQYAKRQMTWFRRRSDIAWFAPDERKKIFNLVEEWIDN